MDLPPKRVVFTQPESSRTGPPAGVPKGEASADRRTPPRGANSGEQGAKDAGTDDGDDAEDGGVGAPTAEVARCRRSTGLAPRLVRGSDRLDECRQAYAIVRELLAGRWEGY